MPPLIQDARPKIQLPGDDRLLSSFAEEIGRALSAKNIFKRGGAVFVSNDAGDGLVQMMPDAFRSWVEKHLICFKVTHPLGKHMVEYGRTMTVSDADGVLSSPQFIAQLQPIERFNTVRMPAYDRDGYLQLLAPGYDAFTQTFTADNPVIISDYMPVDMAKRLLDELLCEFPFADTGRSKAVAVAAMVTVFGRGMLPKNSLRPCFFFEANAEGAGKTLLVKLATVPVLGNSPAGVKPEGDEEMSKILTACVMEEKMVLCLDNYRGRLASASLEAFLTTTTWMGRILGGSRMFSGQNNVTVFITGNGCTVSPDMRRRSLFCQLHMQDERAEDRVFKNQLDVPELIERRGDILSALYSLILDWHSATQPKPRRTHSAFPDWARIIGGIVEHAGYNCPLDTPKTDVATDTDGADMRILVQTVCEGTSKISVKFGDLVQAARTKGLFDRFIPDGGEMDSKQRAGLGYLFRSYDRRLIGDHRFHADGRGRDKQFVISKRE
jgi:hypothetical protein